MNSLWKSSRRMSAALASLLRGRMAVVLSAQWSAVAFRAAGLNPTGSAAPLRSETAPRMFPFLPNSDSLLLSDEGLYEYAAWIYYW